MKVDGLHHVTAITADIETNLDFYGRLLGLRSAGGRVVKLIGDEVLYTARDELSACTIALILAKILTDHPVVPRCAPVWQAVP
jgi:catechol 2,3-dioxygenase-like lactoylglutathione lyase family enzyme